MQTILALDTAMNACTVALCANGQVFSACEHMARGQSERLMPMVMDVVGQAGLTLRDIDIFACVNGPGTFTGLRVGLATIRALAQISGKPARAISTFDAVAQSVKAPDNLCIVLETKRTDFYVRTPDGRQSCMTPEQLRDTVQPEWILAGDATARALENTGLANKTMPLACPAPESLIICARNTVDTPDLSPVYLRGADVSVSRQKTAIIK